METSKHATPRPQRRMLWRTAVVATAATAMVPLPLLTASAYEAGDWSGSLMRGRAFGATAGLTHPSAPSVRVGEVALQSLACNPMAYDRTDPGFTTQLNHVALLDVPLPDGTLVAETDQIRNSGHADATPDYAESVEQSTVHEVNLLAGRIRATLVEANAHTRLDDTGFNHHTRSDSYPDAPTFTDASASTGTTFQDLVVDPDGPAGPGAPVRIDEHVGPNSYYALPGLGWVVLNEQKTAGSSYPNPLYDPTRPSLYPKSVHSGIDVNAIHVYLADDPSTSEPESFAGYVGDIVVGHAETRVAPSTGRLSGFAYATRGTVDPFLTSGPQAIVSLPCAGTRGKDGVLQERVRTQASAVAPAPSGSPIATLLQSGTMRSAVSGYTDEDDALSRSTERIESLRLFTDSAGNSRITADVLETVATSTGTLDKVESVGASNIGRLVIDSDGNPATANQTFAGGAPANTKIDLPGLGWVKINEQNCVDRSDPELSTGTCSSSNVVNKEADGDPAVIANTHYNAITVYGLHIKITVPDNPSGLPVGAEIFVSVAHADVAY